MKYCTLKKGIIVAVCLVSGVFFLWGQTSAEPLHTKKISAIVLENAVVCEAIENFKPMNPAVVFPISQGEVFCYTNFDPVHEKTYIFHKWYKKDRLIFTMRLTLSPPKWASFSSIKIRNVDKGPWRVEITDVDDTLLQTLRFSMVD